MKWLPGIKIHKWIQKLNQIFYISLLRIFSFKKLLSTDLAKTSYAGNTLFFVNGKNSQDYFTTPHNTLPSFQFCTTGENCSMREEFHSNLTSSS